MFKPSHDPIQNRALFRIKIGPNADFSLQVAVLPIQAKDGPAGRSILPARDLAHLARHHRTVLTTPIHPQALGEAPADRPPIIAPTNQAHASYQAAEIE